MHVFASTVSWDTIQDKELFSREMYSRTKLALIHYTRELQNRLTKNKIDTVYVNSCHPGLVRTEMFEANYNTDSMNDRFMRFCAISPAKGAITPLYAAADEDIQRCGYKGQYFVPFAHLAYPSEQAQNEELAQETCRETEEFLRKYYRKDFKLK
jgi:NAD(P)-dependent dehydrogenase (short-subunit alcohol dehydrogenase family)